MPRDHFFDWRGFKFAAKVLVLCIIAGTLGRYGLMYAAQSRSASGPSLVLIQETRPAPGNPSHSHSRRRPRGTSSTRSLSPTQCRQRGNLSPLTCNQWYSRSIKRESQLQNIRYARKERFVRLTRPRRVFIRCSKKNPIILIVSRESIYRGAYNSLKLLYPWHLRERWRSSRFLVCRWRHRA